MLQQMVQQSDSGAKRMQLPLLAAKSQAVQLSNSRDPLHLGLLRGPLRNHDQMTHGTSRFNIWPPELCVKQEHATFPLEAPVHNVRSCRELTCPPRSLR